jgi:2,4-dienoyl-CoA reductase-like NADH-dependent reductase (Old Yellow Enzyme family)
MSVAIETILREQESKRMNSDPAPQSARRGALEPAMLGKLQLRNRIIKAATFEGMTPDGIPGEALRNFHCRLAEGGIAMTTLAYCAVEADGRINDQMMYMHQGIQPQLRALVDAVHARGARVSGQVGHCGNFTKNRKLQRLKRPLGPSRQLNLLGLPAGLPFAGAMTVKDIDYMVERFREAARFMKETGFDALEIHFGHGYGLSQFISPRTNRRTDAYGGSLDNRMRLPLRVLEAVRDAVGEDFPILGKISMMDGVRNGIEIEDAVEIAAALDRGGIDAIVTSGGTSSFNVMKMFRGDSVLKGLIEQERNPIARLGLRLIGPRMFRKYPYEELYFLDDARRIRDRVQCQLVYIGGCSTRASIDTVMREGFDFVQLGRPLLKDPDFVNHAMGDPGYDSGCTHCNRCVALIDHPDGIRCPLNDARAA